jgi:predicted choloylglycine hydrolase
MDSLLIQNIHLIRLKGTHRERAEQHGRMIAALPRDEQRRLAFTPLSKKNQSLIRRTTQRIPGVGKLMGGLYEAFVLERFIRLPKAYRNRLEPFAKASRIPLKKIWLSLYQPDLLMVLAASANPKMRNRFLLGLPGCSTVRIFSAGATYFLRNLDYPAASFWEKNQAVFFHEPSEAGSQKFVSVSSLGMHTSGLTGWNESGIAFSLHAHFSKRTSLKGVPIFFLGEEILEQARTLEDAIELCRKFRPMGSWALNLTSFKENKSVTVELVHGDLFIRSPNDPCGIAHSNFLQSPEFQKHQIHFSGAFFEDSESRKSSLEAHAQKLASHFSWPEALGVMGCSIDPNTQRPRVFGNVISGITNIQSVAFDPKEHCLYLSTRQETPTGLGPYLKIPFDFDSIDPNASPEMISIPEAPAPPFQKALHLYHQAYVSWQVQNEDASVAHSFLIQACEALPTDPHLQMQRGYFELIDGQAQEAWNCFNLASKMHLSDHLQKVAIYFRACASDLLGQRESAIHDYQSILSPEKANEKVDEKLGKRAKKRLNRPFQASYCKRIEPDLQFVEPLNYP